MITKEEMAGLFADLKKNAPWDSSGPLLWSYFFADPSRAKLQGLVPLLLEQGYQLAGIYDAKPRDGMPALCWLHVEKVEKHTVDTLDARNQEFYRLASEHGIEAYDGMDVGPAD